MSYKGISCVQFNTNTLYISYISEQNVSFNTAFWASVNVKFQILPPQVVYSPFVGKYNKLPLIPSTSFTSAFTLHL